MKLLHLSDLHLGKRVNEFSMIPDQRYILRQILAIVGEEAPDGVLLAGDIYDKAVPSAEAVELFDEFLYDLAQTGTDIFIISGNHDSPERIAFGGRLMRGANVFVCPVYDGTIKPIVRSDGYGPVAFYLLPFLKPAHVRRFFPEEAIETYTDALRVALSAAEDVPGARKVLLTHQFVTGAERSESEEISVGGSDNVDATVFDGFDYVALGHIHRPQNVLRPTIRYCGTPLKYSFSEAGHSKSVTVVELGAPGQTTIRTIGLRPQRDLVELRGSYEELAARDFYFGKDFQQAYLHITLTDEDDIPDAIGKLRSIYPKIMRLDYDNRRTRMNQNPMLTAPAREATPLELLEQLYEKQNNAPMSDEQREFAAGLIESIWEVRT